jgi:hypothetical protein
MADHPEPQLNLLLDDDKQTMHLTINGDGKLLAGIVLTAEQLDQTIAGLLSIRGDMVPEFPTTLSEGEQVRAIKGTHFDFGVRRRGSWSSRSATKASAGCRSASVSACSSGCSRSLGRSKKRAARPWASCK